MKINAGAPAWRALRAGLLVAAAAVLCPPVATPQPAPTPAGADLPVVAPPDSAASGPNLPAPALRPLESDTLRRAATANPRPAIVRRVRLDHGARNVVRMGPGNHFAIVGVEPRHATFPVIAKSEDWINVRLSDARTGWVHSSLCTEFDDLSDLEFRPNPRLYSRTGSYALGAYAGAYAFDRKSNSLVLGGRLGYYVFDRLQAEAGVAWTHIRRPQEIVESLFDLSLEAEDFHLLFYHLNLTWEILPGRQMVPFVTAGAGSAIMQGETEPSFNFGAGTELFLAKRVAMRWEFRTHRFHSGSADARFTNHNAEFTLGTIYLF